MGVVIVGAKMPSNCWECELGYAEQTPLCGFMQDNSDQELYKDSRHPDCPLKESED